MVGPGGPGSAAGRSPMVQQQHANEPFGKTTSSSSRQLASAAQPSSRRDMFSRQRPASTRERPALPAMTSATEPSPEGTRITGGTAATRGPGGPTNMPPTAGRFTAPTLDIDNTSFSSPGPGRSYRMERRTTAPFGDTELVSVDGDDNDSFEHGSPFADLEDPWQHDQPVVEESPSFVQNASELVPMSSSRQHSVISIDTMPTDRAARKRAKEERMDLLSRALSTIEEIEEDPNVRRTSGPPHLGGSTQPTSPALGRSAEESSTPPQLAFTAGTMQSSAGPSSSPSLNSAAYSRNPSGGATASAASSSPRSQLAQRVGLHEPGGLTLSRSAVVRDTPMDELEQDYAGIELVSAPSGGSYVSAGNQDSGRATPQVGTPHAAAASVRNWNNSHNTETRKSFSDSRIAAPGSSMRGGNGNNGLRRIPSAFRRAMEYEDPDSLQNSESSGAFAPASLQHVGSVQSGSSMSGPATTTSGFGSFRFGEPASSILFGADSIDSPRASASNHGSLKGLGSSGRRGSTNLVFDFNNTVQVAHARVRTMMDQVVVDADDKRTRSVALNLTVREFLVEPTATNVLSRRRNLRILLLGGLCVLVAVGIAIGLAIWILGG